MASLLAGLEITARVYDGHRQFRFQLLKTLGALQRAQSPPTATRDAALEWPEGALCVRDTEYVPPPAEPYVLGGKVIAGAQPNARQKFIWPVEVAGRKRLIILGESAAFGFPLAYGESFAARLEQRLKGEGYAVLNAAQPAWTSGRLVPVAHRIVDQFEPETLILYLGNNEWFHWSPVDEGPSPRRLGLLKFLAGSRVLAYIEFRLISRQVDRAYSYAGEFDQHHQLIGFDYALQHPLAQPPADWEGVKRSFLANFETNLRDILQLAKQNRVRVILLTVPFSYRLSPAWMYPQPLAFSDGNAPVIRQSLDQAAADLQAGQPGEALEPLERALQREPAVPLPHYLKATALEAQGKLAEAEASYATAREKTVGHLGSILSINATIRKVAAATGTELIDLPPLFDRYEHNLSHYCNDDLIMDDCHPTPLGHRLIAEALLAQLSPRSGSGPAHLP